MLVKQLNAKRKMISEYIITHIVKGTCRNFNSFNFQQFSIFMNDNIGLRSYSPVIASMYFCKLKIYAKLQEKTLAKWNMPIHHVPTVSCVNLRSQIFICNVFICCQGRFKVAKKQSLRMSWNYQNESTRAPIIKIQVVWDFFKQADYNLIMEFSLVWLCC